MIGIAAYFVASENWEKKDVRGALGLFVLQLGLNVLWSMAFFGMHSPFYALIVIAGIWLATAATIFKFREISVPAASFMVPYIIWISFAAVLNYFVWMMN